MDFNQRELFLYRIKSGYLRYKIGNIVIYIRTPTIDVEYEAAEIWNQTYEEAKNDGLMSDDDVFMLLCDLNLWSEQKQKELDDIIPKHIDHWKINLFESEFQSNTRIKIRQYLDRAKIEYNDLLNIRHSYDYVTDRGLADNAKYQFIIANSCFDNQNKSIDWSEYNFDNVYRFYQGSILSQEVLREIARTNPWRDEWTALRKNGRIFDTYNLSYEQKNLIIWSTLYDNIGEHPEPPSEEVLQDDDMLDGWLLVQKNKNEESRRKQAGDKINIKGNEIFIPAETIEDARKIEKLNVGDAARIKQSRLSQLKKENVVKEQNFNDSKFEQKMQAVNMYRNTVKGR